MTTTPSFLVGADFLTEFPKWRASDEILRLAHLLVVNRPGAPPPDVAALVALEAALPAGRERVLVLNIPA